MLAGIIGALVGFVLTALVLGAQESPSSRENRICESDDITNCRSHLQSNDWVLRYKAESPHDLMDVHWLIEVWIKGDYALLCELRAGRARRATYKCQALETVTGSRLSN
jgi:hypothetical protein